jgi:hypothetical protein
MSRNVFRENGLSLCMHATFAWCLHLVFPRESHFVISGKAGKQILFPGIPGIPGIDFYLIKLEKVTF